MNGRSNQKAFIICLLEDSNADSNNSYKWSVGNRCSNNQEMCIKTYDVWASSEPGPVLDPGTLCLCSQGGPILGTGSCSLRPFSAQAPCVLCPKISGHLSIPPSRL